MTLRNERTTGNRVLPQLAVTCKIEVVYSYQTFVQVDSEVLRNCSLRQNVSDHYTLSVTLHPIHPRSKSRYAGVTHTSVSTNTTIDAGCNSASSATKNPHTNSQYRTKGNSRIFYPTTLKSCGFTKLNFCLFCTSSTAKSITRAISLMA